ncbi:MAG: YdcF family protein [Ferruginibacter sp.]
MFFILSKLLSFLLSPFNWLLLFIVLALFTKKAVRKKRLTILSIAWFLLFSNPFIIHHATLGWQEPKKELATNETYKVGIVLAGFVSFNFKENKGYYGTAADRFIQAVELYKTGHIKKLMISGGSGSLFKQQYKEADFVKQEFMKMGVPAEDIITENQSRNTFENARNSKLILDSMQLPGPYLLITSAMHMKRSKAVFKKAGLAIVPYPANFAEIDNPVGFADAIIPTEDAFDGWEKLLREMVGLWVYKLTGKA